MPKKAGSSDNKPTSKKAGSGKGAAKADDSDNPTKVYLPVPTCMMISINVIHFERRVKVL